MMLRIVRISDSIRETKCAYHANKITGVHKNNEKQVKPEVIVFVVVNVCRSSGATKNTSTQDGEQTIRKRPCIAG